MKNLKNKYLTSNNSYPIISTNAKTIKTTYKNNVEKVLAKKKYNKDDLEYCTKRNAYKVKMKNGAERYIYC